MACASLLNYSSFCPPFYSFLNLHSSYEPAQQESVFSDLGEGLRENSSGVRDFGARSLALLRSMYSVEDGPELHDRPPQPGLLSGKL